MSLVRLLPALASDAVVYDLHARIGADAGRFAVTDLPASSRPGLLAALLHDATTPTLIVTSRADRADALAASLNAFLPRTRQARLWIGPDALPYEQLPFDLKVAAERVAILAALRDSAGNPAPIVVASAHGLMHLVMTPADLDKYTITITPGTRLTIDTLVAFVTKLGFQPAPVVQEPGAMARRGGIVDLWPPAAEFPVRIDFFGDEIDTIRQFNAGTQRSDKRLQRLTLHPPSELPLWRLPDAAAALADLDVATLRDEVRSEWLHEVEQMQAGITPASVDIFAPYLVAKPATLVDHFPASTLVVLDEPSAIRIAIQNLEHQGQELLQGFIANGELPAGLRRPFAGWLDLAPRLDGRRSLHVGIDSEIHDRVLVSLTGLAEAPFFAGRVQRLADDIAERLADGWTVTIATDQVDRLTTILGERGLQAHKMPRDDDEARPLPPGSLEIGSAHVDGGWALPAAKTLLLSDLELFGFRKVARQQSRRSITENLAFATSLTPGEYVVHIDHGIAQFVGLVRATAGEVEREYLLLEYDRGDKLYVPVDQSDRVTRYGGGGLEPHRTKLGSGEWVRAKQKVRKAVREMAYELVQLYAAREAGSGRRFPPDTSWDHELEVAFPYQETPDQRRAIDEVKSAMESDRAMDRLICGDVGFGKTEVALRAAFKAVNGGTQVAILVPTTVLALQHYETFTRRLGTFPIRVEMLSRLRSKKEQTKILADLVEGAIDMIIGTHRLVSRDVRFKDLGLVIIDEEQRFGVRHKEHLKQLRTEVDVLTMSATPIPRTLHMALSGIRDISVINTAPTARVPIRTFVTDTSDQLVREVILREIDRGGQVYFVHNRVQGIDKLASHLRKLVPEATFGVGHGQMDEEVLEEVILSFVRHEFDVLIATTIIESGIDIPNVNTIVIDNADTLGLTQLYQLRGRVGRGAKRAYAYLLVKPQKPLSQEALARLEAIQEATELGAGLQVAMRDMEIRGAGNILGAEQSGHIAALGYDLYIRLLAQAVEEIRQGRPFAEKGAITLDLPLSALIPADYISDTELRLATYRRIALVEDAAGLGRIREELSDRFGDPPVEVERLYALIALRLRCTAFGIDSIVEREREIVLRPLETARIDQRRLQRELGNAIRFTPNSLRLRLPDLQIGWQEALDLVLDAVELAMPRSAAS